MPEQDAVAADLTALEAEIEKIARERETLHEQLLRTMADMQNYKRRVEQERQQIQLRATEALLRDLLPVLDSFDRTIASIHAGASPVSVMEGAKSVDRQLRGVLESRKLKRIASKGEMFDPALHEAILVDPDSELPQGTIVEELEAGYLLGDQVLRPARVKVAKGAA
jgi:molecular chaperone GrpE